MQVVKADAGAQASTIESRELQDFMVCELCLREGPRRMGLESNMTEHACFRTSAGLTCRDQGGLAVRGQYGNDTPASGLAVKERRDETVTLLLRDTNLWSPLHHRLLCCVLSVC